VPPPPEPKAPPLPEPKAPPLTEVKATATPKPKASRATPPAFTRLFINVGLENGVGQEDIVTAIMGHTGLAPKVIGTVDIRDRHVFVDVASENANAIIAKLNRAEINGKKVKIKAA
jgi:ATP-dependent RNA helicase DeaD